MFKSGMLVRIRNFTFYVWEHTESGFRLMVGHKEGAIMRGLFAIRAGVSRYLDSEKNPIEFKLFHIFGVWVEIRLG